MGGSKMSEQVTNLKVRFGADTKNFKKGLDDGKQASQQFQKTAGSAFDSFAAAFGVNMGKVREGLNTVKSSLTGTAGGFKTATAGSNIFTRSLAVLKSALIATGIGALVVALGSLVSYFTKTQRGADFVSQTMKAIGAITSVLVDRFSALGEIMFNAFKNPKQAVADLWEAIETNIVNRFEGLIDLFGAVGSGLESLWKRDMEGLKNAANEAGRAMLQITSGLDEGQQKRIAAGIKGIATEIKEETKASIELEKARQSLEKQEIAFIETESRLRKEIDKNRLAEKDFQLSTEERLEANKKANALVLELEKERKELQQERIRIMQQEIDMGESMNSDLKALAEEKAKLNQIEGEAARMQRELMEGSKTLTTQIQAETAAVMKLREEKTAMFKPLDTLGLEVPKLEIPKLETDKLLSQLQTDLGEAKNVVIDFTDTFNNAFANVAEGFAESLGSMLAGTGDVKNFGEIVKSTFAGFAVEAGRVIMKAGIAFFAIGEALKKALTTPGAALAAVAAGAALMAAGKAAQASLNDVASGGSGNISSNSFVYDTRTASAGLGQTTGGLQTQTVQVHVTGEFKQRGSDLVAVVNETHKRSGYRGTRLTRT